MLQEMESKACEELTRYENEFAHNHCDIGCGDLFLMQLLENDKYYGLALKKWATISNILDMLDIKSEHPTDLFDIVTDTYCYVNALGIYAEKEESV